MFDTDKIQEIQEDSDSSQFCYVMRFEPSGCLEAINANVFMTPKIDLVNDYNKRINKPYLDRKAYEPFVNS